MACMLRAPAPVFMCMPHICGPMRSHRRPGGRRRNAWAPRELQTTETEGWTHRWSMSVAGGIAVCCTTPRLDTAAPALAHDQAPAPPEFWLSPVCRRCPVCSGRCCAWQNRHVRHLVQSSLPARCLLVCGHRQPYTDSDTPVGHTCRRTVQLRAAFLRRGRRLRGCWHSSLP